MGDITFASLFFMFLCWPPLFILGLNLYGYRVKPLNLIFACVWMEVIVVAILKVSMLQRIGPFIECFSIFLLLWQMRFRREIVETLIIAATTSGIFTLIKGIAFFIGDPTSRVAENITIALVLTVTAQIVAYLKIQFTFIRSPRVKAKHGSKLKKYSLTFIVISAVFGYFMTYLPETFAKTASVMVIIDLALLLHNLRMEFD